MNKNKSKNCYNLDVDDTVLLLKFSSSKHLHYSDRHDLVIGRMAVFKEYTGYRNRQSIVELDGKEYVWRTESLKHVAKLDPKDFNTAIVGYGQIEFDVKESNVNPDTVKTITGGLHSNYRTHGNLKIYGRSNFESGLGEGNDAATSTIPLSTAQVETNFNTKVIDKEKALEIIKDPTKFIKELERDLEKAEGYPKFNKYVDVTNPYDILKELVRLRDKFNKIPGAGYEYVISFEENNTGHKVITVKPKDFIRSIFTFNSEKKAKKFLEEFSEYLKIISRVFF